MYLVAKGSDIKLVNKLNQKPIILSEDQTMIRLLTALEKKSEGGGKVIQGDRRKYQGSAFHSHARYLIAVATKLAVKGEPFECVTVLTPPPCASDRL